MFLPDLQGLRAVAVLLVIGYHASVPGLAGGYVGVDVFFVISGYLIGGLLVRERERTGTVSFREFYARRARRLLPAAFAAIVGAIAVSRLVLAPLEQMPVTASALAAVLYASNLLFGYRSTDYLGGQSALDPLLHTWSLAVEEQFYLVWPALVLVAAMGAARARVRARIAAAFVIACVLSLAACLYLTRWNLSWAFFGTHARAWEFGAGALVYLYAADGVRLGRAGREIFGALAVLLIGIAAVTFDRQSDFPGWLALLPVAGTSLAIVAGRSPEPSIVTRALSLAPLVWIGNISYSLYLWHWPALVGSSALQTGPRGTIAALGAAVVVASLSYRWLEHPIRHSATLRARPGVTLAGALAATVVMALAAGGVRRAMAVDLTLDGQWAATAAQADLPIVYAHGCNANSREVTVGACAFADTASARTIVLYGDSHAAHWFPAIEALATNVGARLVSLTKSACPSVDVPVTSAEYHARAVDCDEWRANATARILALRPSLVVIANYSRNVGADHEGRPIVTPASNWRAGLSALLSRLSTGRIATLVLLDNPAATQDVPTCVSRALHEGRSAAACGFSVTAATRRDLGFYAAERAAAAAFADASVLDMTPFICPAERCDIAPHAVPRYRDRHHLTATFSRSLAPRIHDHLARWAADSPGSAVSALLAVTVR